MPAKPKTPQPETPHAPQQRDQFSTPDYATDIIIPFIPREYSCIWEFCAGAGKMVSRLRRRSGLHVIASSIEDDPPHDCLTTSPSDVGLGDDIAYCIITNPPFSIKKKVFERCVELNVPFALLIPGDWSAWTVNAVRSNEDGGYGCRIVLPTRRINYITPNGRSGKESQSQFHSIWLTRYFDVPDIIHVVDLTREQMLNI